jgi:phage terminase large subunit
MQLSLTTYVMNSLLDGNERRDENRNVGLGQEHDWSSHAADAFGYLAISYEEPPVKSTGMGRPPPPRAGSHWAA